MTTLTDTAELTISTTVWDDPLAAGGLDADSGGMRVRTWVRSPVTRIMPNRSSRARVAVNVDGMTPRLAASSLIVHVCAVTSPVR